MGNPEDEFTHAYSASKAARYAKLKKWWPAFALLFVIVVGAIGAAILSKAAAEDPVVAKIESAAAALKDPTASKNATDELKKFREAKKDEDKFSSLSAEYEIFFAEGNFSIVNDIAEAARRYTDNGEKTMLTYFWQISAAKNQTDSTAREAKLKELRSEASDTLSKLNDVQDTQRKAYESLLSDKKNPEPEDQPIKEGPEE